MQTKFDNFNNAIQQGAEDLAREIFKGFEGHAKEYATAFTKKAEADMRRWSTLLADKELTRQDLADLVHAKNALAEIHALSQEGIELAKLERFRSGLISLVVDKAVEVFA